MIAWINLNSKSHNSSSILYFIVYPTDCNALPSASPVCTVCSLPLLVYVGGGWGRKLAIDGKHVPLASVYVPWLFARSLGK
jgi:hypothetical protein